MGSIYREAEMRNAGIALVGAGLIVGGLLGNALEGAVCKEAPSITRLSFVGGALVVVLLDLAYRAGHRAAAEREGWRRFVNPMSGGRLFVVVPAWLVGAGLLLVAVAWGLRDGFC